MAAPVQSQRVDLLRQAFSALRAQRFRDAIAASSVLVAREPNDVEAQALLGLALACTGDLEKAPALLLAVAAARPGNAHPILDLAQVLPGPAHASLIAAQFDAAVRIAPADPALACAHAGWLASQGCLGAAATRLSGVLDCAAPEPRLHIALGRVRAEQGDLASAEASFRTALTLAPDSAAAWSNLGTALTGLNRFAAAQDAFERALEKQPGDQRIRLNQAHALLKSGDYRAGWPAYEAALSQHGRTRLPRHTLLPPLRQVGEIRKRRILLLHEQGLGDSVQFLRYAPLLAARGAEVSVIVPRALVRLARSMEGVAWAGTDGDPVPAFDYHAPLMRMPFVFGTELANIPAEMPYIHADPGLVAAWAQRLPASARRVGLCWAGAPRSEHPDLAAVDRRRSIGLSLFSALGAAENIAFVSLQMGPAAAEARLPPPGLRLFDPMANVADLADTAAIIANLDQVVTVDTVIAHLAAAIGKPVFLLDRLDNCWRWLANRQDSPWYPSLRIFRQTRGGEWGDVLYRVRVALQSGL